MSRPFDDTLMELLVSRALRVGVYTSSFFLLLGFLVSLLHPESLSHPTGHPSIAQLFSLLQPDSKLLNHLLDPYLHFYLGIIILLLTPIIRVLIAIVSFALEKDTRFAFISVTVLLIILLSLSLSVG